MPFNIGIFLYIVAYCLTEGMIFAAAGKAGKKQVEYFLLDQLYSSRSQA